MCEGALQAYQSLVKQYGQEEVGTIEPGSGEFDELMRTFAEDTVSALDLTVHNYSPSSGFADVSCPCLMKRHGEAGEDEGWCSCRVCWRST